MSTADDLELRAAELAATGGPVFDLGLAANDAVVLILAEFDLARIRHAAIDDIVVVHHNDREVARSIVTRLLGDGYESVETADVPGAGFSVSAEPTVTIYTAGDMVQADLIRARLRASGIDSRLRYDPTMGVARYLAYDKTVDVEVVESQSEAAREVLNGVELDTGSNGVFRSRAWATPLRSLGAILLLALVACFAVGLGYGIVELLLGGSP
ncbi:MAG: DUF2007 domain-containing protein [Actinomycetia bacterium]|nr:DUF2007 domain-containing protein [Actinomycetes bacterium]